MHTPTVQKIMKDSLFHSAINKQNRLMLSIMQSTAEANFTLSQKLFEQMALRIMTEMSTNAEPISSSVVHRFRLRSKVVDGTHWCILKSLAWNSGHELTHELSFSMKKRSVTEPFSKRQLVH